MERGLGTWMIFLIILGKNQSMDIQGRVQAVANTFKENGKGLSFTYELLDENTSQFLDVNLQFLRGHTCWMYSPRVRKELLPYDLAYSKLVKGTLKAKYKFVPNESLTFQ